MQDGADWTVDTTLFMCSRGIALVQWHLCCSTLVSLLTNHSRAYVVFPTNIHKLQLVRHDSQGNRCSWIRIADVITSECFPFCRDYLCLNASFPPFSDLSSSSASIASGGPMIACPFTILRSLLVHFAAPAFPVAQTALLVLAADIYEPSPGRAGG